jgi:hypothetical protein
MGLPRAHGRPDGCSPHVLFESRLASLHACGWGVARARSRHSAGHTAASRTTREEARGEEVEGGEAWRGGAASRGRESGWRQGRRLTYEYVGAGEEDVGDSG